MPAQGPGIVTKAMSVGESEFGEPFGFSTGTVPVAASLV